MRPIEIARTDTGTVVPSEAGAPPKDWSRIVKSYRQADDRRAWFELAVTAVPFLAGWAGMALAVSFGWWPVWLALVVPTAGFLVRLFMIQHDCGHNAFFSSRQRNDWAGRILGVLTMTPYAYWRHSHAIHHASAGNLDHRGIGDIDTLTVAEYAALGRWQRLQYRLYRNPLVMFGLGPSYIFVLKNRLPFGFIRKGAGPWISTMGTNAAILALAVLLGSVVGFGTYLAVTLPVVVVAATIGVWLFYVQHQFEETFWEHARDWNAEEAALHGSSYYVLPGWLQWMTANIGIHHVHHLSSRIPYYRLSEVLRDHPELTTVGRLTIAESLACVRYVLWDEEARRLISFAEYRRRRPDATPSAAPMVPLVSAEPASKAA